MNDFNLIDTPWISVRWVLPAHRNPPLVSLGDAFLRSSEIADLDCAPHERIALTRLLVCLTHAALGAPEDEDDWEGFGKEIESAVPAYLAQPAIHSRFNLLGDGPRFLQRRPASISPEDGYPLSKICFNLSSGNNPKLLDHWGEDSRPWPPAAVALALLCLQNFFVGGSMASKVKGNGPALKSLQMLLAGSSLRKTILRNCLDLKTIAETGAGLGHPVWETPADGGLLSRLAPVSCALWLSDDFDTVFIDQGHQYLEFESYRDPYASTETLKDDRRRLIRAKPDQGIWRDLHLLTNLTNATGSSAPLNLQCFNRRKEIGEFTDLWVGELIKAKDAKIEDCTESSFTIPHRLFDRNGREIYAVGVAWAETISRSLYGAIKTYGSILRNEHPPVSEGQKHFWHQLDQSHRILILMAGDPQPSSTAIGDPGASDPWTALVRRAAVHAYESVCPHATPRQIQAHAAGKRILQKALFPKPPSLKKNVPQSPAASVHPEPDPSKHDLSIRI